MEENPFGDMDEAGTAGGGQDSKKAKSLGFLDGLFQSQHFSSALKELVHPGQKPLDISMRTVLEDANEARDLALTLAKLEEFNMQREMTLLLNLMALRTSIGGRGRQELLQAITGYYTPPKSNRLGIPFGRKKAEDNHDRD